MNAKIPLTHRRCVAGGGTLEEAEDRQREQHTTELLTAAEELGKPAAKGDGSLALEATPSMLLPAPDAPLLSQIDTVQPHVSNGLESATGTRPTTAANGDAHLASPDSAKQKGEKPAEGACKRGREQHRLCALPQHLARAVWLSLGEMLRLDPSMVHHMSHR